MRSYTISNFSSGEPFLREVFALCHAKLDVSPDEPPTKENFVHLVAASLLKLVPNIILNKREEAVPLLVGAVHLNDDPSERDELLQQLFNLKKRPSEAERGAILAGEGPVSIPDSKFQVSTSNI